MYGSGARRCRAVAFTPLERSVLLDAVMRYRHILANVCADQPAAQTKRAAWEAITRAYNANRDVVKRNAEQLKTCWENLKYRVRVQRKSLPSDRGVGRESVSVVPDDVVMKVEAIMSYSAKANEQDPSSEENSIAPHTGSRNGSFSSQDQRESVEDDRDQNAYGTEENHAEMESDCDDVVVIKCENDDSEELEPCSSSTFNTTEGLPAPHTALAPPLNSEQHWITTSHAHSLSRTEKVCDEVGKTLAANRLDVAGVRSLMGSAESGKNFKHIKPFMGNVENARHFRQLPYGIRGQMPPRRSSHNRYFSPSQVNQTLIANEAQVTNQVQARMVNRVHQTVALPNSAPAAEAVSRSVGQVESDAWEEEGDQREVEGDRRALHDQRMKELAVRLASAQRESERQEELFQLQLTNQRRENERLEEMHRLLLANHARESERLEELHRLRVTLLNEQIIAQCKGRVAVATGEAQSEATGADNGQQDSGVDL